MFGDLLSLKNSKTGYKLYLLRKYPEEKYLPDNLLYTRRLSELYNSDKFLKHALYLQYKYI